MLNRNVLSAMAALILVVAACGKDYMGPGEGLDSATYTLQTINGQSVPLTVALRNNNTVRIEIISGTFSIVSSSRFTSATTYRRTENGQATTSVENCIGAYAVSPLATGARVTFTEVGSENASCGAALSLTGVGGRNRTYTGTWDGANTFTVDFDVSTRSVYAR